MVQCRAIGLRCNWKAADFFRHVSTLLPFSPIVPTCLRHDHQIHSFALVDSIRLGGRVATPGVENTKLISTGNVGVAGVQQSQPNIIITKSLHCIIAGVDGKWVHTCVKRKGVDELSWGSRFLIFWYNGYLTEEDFKKATKCLWFKEPNKAV